MNTIKNLIITFSLCTLTTNVYSSIFTVVNKGTKPVTVKIDIIARDSGKNVIGHAILFTEGLQPAKSTILDSNKYLEAAEASTISLFQPGPFDQNLDPLQTIDVSLKHNTTIELTSKPNPQKKNELIWTIKTIEKK